MRPRTSSAGLSLAELLLYQGLLLLLLTLVVLFLVPSLRLQNRGLTQAEQLRCCHLLVDELCHDLRLTPQVCLSNQSGLLSGRLQAGWTSDGTVLLEDQGWFFELATGRRAQLSWGQTLGLAQTWQEPLSLAQVNLCRPLLHWQSQSREPVQVHFSAGGGDAGRPRGPYTVAMQIGDLNLQQTVQPRLQR